MPRKTTQPKPERRDGAPNHDAPDLLPPVDFHGYSFRVAENNDLPENEHGATWTEAQVIEIRARHRHGKLIAARSLIDVIFHEFAHAGLNTNGGAHRLRKRLKMSAKQWHAFEEAMILEFIAAILPPAADAGLLVFPKLPRSSRHRRR